MHTPHRNASAKALAAANHTRFALFASMSVLTFVLSLLLLKI